MNTVAVHVSNQGRFSPYFVAIPFAMTIFGCYGAFLPYGILGIVGFAGIGLIWALCVGFVAHRLMRRERWHEWLANAPIFLSIIAIGLLAGAGIMYISMMNAAVGEPSTTYAVLGALMQPAVPYYIVTNSLLELFIMLLVVFFNWHADRKRVLYCLIGVALYLVMRVWTYLVYAETRLDIATHTLSPADVEWFKQTLTTDYRPALVLITQAFFILAAFVPVHSMRDRERRSRE